MKIKELSEEFLCSYAEERLRPSTIRGYRTNIDKHILPYIGGVEIENISTEMLDTLNKCWNNLSNKTKIYCHATLRKMLNFAIKRNYMDKNPYTSFDLPKAKKYDYRTLNEEQIKTLLERVKGESIEAPVTLAICYGLRKGECLGIMEEDLDENNILHIQRTKGTEYREEVITPCKTENGNRYILISKEHSKMLRGTAGKKIKELSSSKLNYRFKKFLKNNNLPEIRFHDLRHSYATLMMKKGINPKIVSSILGHSSVDVTLDIYSHPDVSMQQLCIDIFPK